MISISSGFAMSPYKYETWLFAYNHVIIINLQVLWIVKNDYYITLT